MNTQLHYEVIIARFVKKTREFGKVYEENAEAICVCVEDKIFSFVLKYFLVKPQKYFHKYIGIAVNGAFVRDSTV